jgi:hypothetical protein
MPTTIDTLADSLRAQLDAKRADVVARPGTVTPRGAGTDNYCQCKPLRAAGWELRRYPSTWMKATLGDEERSGLHGCAGGFHRRLSQSDRAVDGGLSRRVFAAPRVGCGGPEPGGGAGRGAEGDGGGGIPLIHYRTEERFREIPAFARSLGVYVGNTHTVTLTEIGPEQTSAHIVLKHDVAPRGLMTPGKMKAVPVNPFEPASA